MWCKFTSSVMVCSQRGLTLTTVNRISNLLIVLLIGYSTGCCITWPCLFCDTEYQLIYPLKPVRHSMEVLWNSRSSSLLAHWCDGRKYDLFVGRVFIPQSKTPTGNIFFAYIICVRLIYIFLFAFNSNAMLDSRTAGYGNDDHEWIY